MDWVPAIARWLHFMAGVMWIGLLYYFNFVQAAALKAATADGTGDWSPIVTTGWPPPILTTRNGAAGDRLSSGASVRGLASGSLLSLY